MSLSPTLFPVVIDRNTWYRGRGAFGSKLLIPEMGKMCCLGHVALACGLTPADIENKTSPCKIHDNHVKCSTNIIPLPAAMAKLVNDASYNSSICERMMNVNDDRDLESSAREDTLITLGKEAGLALSFVDAVSTGGNISCE